MCTAGPWDHRKPLLTMHVLVGHDADHMHVLRDAKAPGTAPRASPTPPFKSKRKAVRIRSLRIQARRPTERFARHEHAHHRHHITANAARSWPQRGAASAGGPTVPSAVAMTPPAAARLIRYKVDWRAPPLQDGKCQASRRRAMSKLASLEKLPPRLPTVCSTPSLGGSCNLASVLVTAVDHIKQGARGAAKLLVYAAATTSNSVAPDAPSPRTRCKFVSVVVTPVSTLVCADPLFEIAHRAQAIRNGIEIHAEMLCR